MKNELSIAFIGGGNMASALATGLADKVCPARHIHVIDINQEAHAAWQARGMSAALAPDETLARSRVWIFAVKPQNMRDVVASARQWLQPDTLVISVAAGIRADTLAAWLGAPGAPWGRLGALHAQHAGPGRRGRDRAGGAGRRERRLTARWRRRLLGSVGQVVWVDGDDAMTA
nr:NAD(P)-binding domain-containing protein [Achromobacter sp. DMS1]